MPTGYNHQEELQINFIYDTYKSIFEVSTVPAELETVEVSGWIYSYKIARYEAEMTSFQVERLRTEMSPGPLYNHAVDILTKICAYQRYKQNLGYFSRGHLGDPRHLVFQEFKKWVQLKLSGGINNTELLSEVKKRILYINAIESQNIFESYASQELHLNSVLLEISEILGKTKKQIELNIAEEKARESIGYLLNYSKALSKDVIKYLFYILRSHAASDDCSLDNIANPNLNEATMKTFMSTHSGKMLHELVKLPEFNLPSKLSNAESSDRMPLATRSQIALDRILQSNNAYIEPSEDTLANLNTQNATASGIAEIFRSKNEVIIHFVKLHGLMIEFSYFILIAENFYSLAGDGGDIFIYGFMNDYFKKFITASITLVEQIISRLDAIHEVALCEYRTGLRTARENDWMNNYRKANGIKTLITTEISSLQTLMSDILNRIRRGIDAERLRDIEGKVHFCISAAGGFSHRLSKILPSSECEPIEGDALPNEATTASAVHLVYNPAVNSPVFKYLYKASRASRPQRPLVESDEECEESLSNNAYS